MIVKKIRYYYCLYIKQEQMNIFEKRVDNFFFFGRKTRQYLFEQNFGEVIGEKGFYSKFNSQLMVIQKHHLGKEIDRTRFDELVKFQNEIRTEYEWFEPRW
jgi:hypothetical protein